MWCRAQEQPGTSAGTVAQVVQASEVLILALPGQFEDAGIQEIAASLGDVKGEGRVPARQPPRPRPQEKEKVICQKRIREAVGACGWQRS